MLQTIQQHKNWLIPLVIVLVFGLAVFFWGRSTSKRVKLPALGKDNNTDEISPSEASTMAMNLIQLLDSGWVTTHQEYMDAVKLVKHLDREDLRLVHDAYLNIQNKDYPTVRALFNAQNLFWSTSYRLHEDLMERFTLAGI